MSNCTEKLYHPKIVLKDKKSKSAMTFLNPKRAKVEKTRVDGCAITEGKKCDFLVRDKDVYEYFVELKGKDIKHACAQLEASILQLSKHPKKVSKHSIVISTRCPLTDSEIQKLKKQFKQKYRAKLVIKNKKWEITINN